jgi:predicted lactoylglutathione lyase
MKSDFPGAVPEIPVLDVDKAAEYYVSLGFSLDWGGEEAGIAGISNGNCRLFLTNGDFRQQYGNSGPVLIWLNLDSNEDVDQLHEQWKANQARVVSPPESKPWGLREFTVADIDGNLLRVFHDFATPARAVRVDT